MHEFAFIWNYWLFFFLVFFFFFFSFLFRSFTYMYKFIFLVSFSTENTYIWLVQELENGSNVNPKMNIEILCDFFFHFYHHFCSGFTIRFIFILQFDVLFLSPLSNWILLYVLCVFRVFCNIKVIFCVFLCFNFSLFRMSFTFWYWRRC